MPGRPITPTPLCPTLASMATPRRGHGPSHRVRGPPLQKDHRRVRAGRRPKADEYGWDLGPCATEGTCTGLGPIKPQQFVSQNCFDDHGFFAEFLQILRAIWAYLAECNWRHVRARPGPHTEGIIFARGPPCRPARPRQDDIGEPCVAPLALLPRATEPYRASRVESTEDVPARGALQRRLPAPFVT